MLRKMLTRRSLEPPKGFEVASGGRHTPISQPLKSAAACYLESYVCLSTLSIKDICPELCLQNHQQEASNRRARDRKGLVCTQTRGPYLRGNCNDTFDRLS